ncbi:hypothetical protein MMC30_002897 [Trapelia coarctata]|nr:hypothetical protein [Trapelia coarctata]
MPVPNGGPKPTNTLVSYQSKPPSAFEISSVPGAGARILQTLSSLGDLVSAPWSKTPSSQQYESEHASKRMKMGHPGPVRVVPTHAEGDSDDFDILGGEGNEHNQHQISVDRAQPATSVTSSLPVRRNAILRTVSNEHETVEAMMNSSAHARQAEEEGRRKRGRPKKTFQMEPRQTQTVAIDLTESEAPTIAHYKGTARPTKLPKVGNFVGASSRHPDTGSTSQFFRNKADSSNSATESGFPMSTGTGQSKHGGQRNVHLRNQFVPTNGKRRGSDFNLSADELAEVDNYGGVSRVPPEKRIKQRSPSKQQQDDTSPIMLSEMEPSNIKATQFTDSGRKAAVRVPRSKKQKRDESPDGHGVEAKTIIMGESLLEADKKDVLFLVFNEKGTTLEVWNNGLNLSQMYPILRIPMQGLLRILWAQGCHRLRLECSRRTGQSSPQIDLELTSEKDVAKLMVDLQERSSSVKLIKSDSATLEKIFEKRKSELIANPTSARDEIVDDDAEMRLLERRKQIREENTADKPKVELGNPKRKQPGSNLIDRLVGCPSSNQSKTALSQPSQSYRSAPETEIKEASYAPKRQTDIDAVLDLVNGHHHDSYLTRSTRSTILNGGATTLKTDPFSLDEGLPEEVRYSKVHGLGTRWKKALIYPKTGKKKTTVDFDDLERLDDGQFLNDNLIGFYLRYLECNLEKERPDVANKVYWFNTYFFASLTQTARGKRGINYEAVRKWTRTIDIFSYDYAIVPINESAHWYVAIICNLRGLDRMPEIGGGDGSSSPTFEGFDGAEDVENVPEQSALQSAGFIDPSREVQEPENPEAKARESFAELKLEDRDLVGNQDKNGAVQSEDELLDDGRVDLVPSSQAKPSGTPPEPKSDKDTIAIQVPNAQKTPTPQKKGKRKPAPSPRTFNPAQPAIITLDSLGLAHSPTVRALKDYLHEEMRDKRGKMDWEDLQMKGITAKQIPLQNNYCDCGLFLLGYMDKFVENPKEFVTKLLQRGYDENKDWPKLIPSKMRTNIRELVQGLHAEQEGERIAVKRKSPVKASAPIDTEEQATQPIPQKATEKQASDRAKINEVPTVQEYTQISEANEVQRATPATKQEALHTALRVDAPDPTPSKMPRVSANGLFQHNPEKHPELLADSAPDLPPIVLDSQEEPRTVPPATLHAVQDEDDALLAQQPEDVTEIPDTPPRPQTRGKPTPEPEIPKTVASPTRGRKAREAMKSSVQQMREVIDIADN